MPIIISNLGDLHRFRKELQQIVALDGKTVKIRFAQQSFATGSMLPPFPSFSEAQKLIAAHHRDINLRMPLTRKEAVKQFREALFADRIETASLREKLNAMSGALTREKFISATNRVLRTGGNQTFQRVLVTVADEVPV